VRFDRKQQNSVKQLSFNNKKIKQHEKAINKGLFENQKKKKIKQTWFAQQAVVCNS